MRAIAAKYVKNLTKKDVLSFFDELVKKDMKKLSMQEFSQKAKQVPSSTPVVRGYQSILIKKINYLRKRNKFLVLAK